MLISETPRQRLNKLAAQLKNARTPYESHWKELGENFAPRRTRFYAQDQNRGDKRHGKIINEHGMLAARTLRSGMFAGITSPARPWRRLTTPDPDLAKFGRVKTWLEHVNKNMRTLDLRSNLYNALPTVFGDVGVFATAAMGVFEDADDGFRCFTFPIGSYWLANNQRNVVDTFLREFQLTVRQVVMQFGEVSASGAPKWEHFSPGVKTLWDAGNYEAPILVSHLIHPNLEYNPKLLDAKYKKFSSCYYESGGSVLYSQQTGYSAGVGTGFLRESGFDEFRILAPRWDVTGEDVYGTDCPGMQALGTTKEVQFLERKKSRAIEKQLNPSLKGPPSLRNQKVSLISGDITYVDERDGKNGLSPIHEVNVSVQDVGNDIQAKCDRIDRTFHVDMFMMLDNLRGVQPRNEREIAERTEEKLLQLGPVLEGLNDDLLEPLTDIEFAIMQAIGMVPEPPEEIAGQPLKVEYESTMAKAQKLVGVAGTERFFSFVGNAAAAFPQALDKIDIDVAVDEYADMMGVSANIVRTEEATQAIRDQKAEAQRKQQMAAQIPQLAEAGKNLSQADLSTDNVLSRVMAGA